MVTVIGCHRVVFSDSLFDTVETTSFWRLMEFSRERYKKVIPSGWGQMNFIWAHERTYVVKQCVYCTGNYFLPQATKSTQGFSGLFCSRLSQTRGQELMWTSLTTFLGIATLSVSKAVLITGMIVFVSHCLLAAPCDWIFWLVDLW